MFERYTERSREVIVDAQALCREWRHLEIDIGHILTALYLQENTIPGRILQHKSSGLTRDSFFEAFKKLYSQGEASGQIPFTPEAKKLLELSLREALSLGHSFIGPEHHLIASTRFPDEWYRVDDELDLDWVRQEVIRELERKPPISSPPR